MTMTDKLWPGITRRWGRDVPLTVLLVDDDPLLREVLSESLAERGHRVIACGDADECLRALPPPGERVLLMTDVAMPGRSGRALADEFRRRCPDQPVVFATGLPAESVTPLRDGEALLLQPFSMRDMVATVDRMAAA